MTGPARRAAEGPGQEMTTGQPLELVIFDCDGVLVDSERIAVDIDVEMLAHFGLNLTREQIIARFVGRSPSVMNEAIEAHLGRPLPEGWNAPFRPRFDERYERELTPVDGVVQALDQIEVPVCVASGSDLDRLDYKLGLTGLHDRFAGAIFSSSQVARGKPAPDVFLFAAERMGVDPARCAVIEDSPFGVQAANAAGMEAFAYAGGVVGPEALAPERATVFSDMRELPELLRGFGTG